jgi:hypothetical protein
MDVGKQAFIKKRFLYWTDLLISTDMEPIICISFRQNPGGSASLNVLTIDGMTREELIEALRECLANVSIAPGLIVKLPNSL